MDNAYLYGFDYDSHRSSIRSSSSGEPVFDSFADEKKRPKRRTWIIMGLLIVAVLLTLSFQALRYIPLFDIDTVSFSVTGGFTDIPQQAREAADGMIGTSLMTGAPRTLEKQLSQLAVVESAKVKRHLFSSLSIELRIAEPSTFVAMMSESDEIESIHMVVDDHLQRIDLSDFKAFGNKVFVVEVGSSYGSHLLTYGLDPGMEKAIKLASDMGLDGDGRYRIIGRVRYEETIGDQFGHMVLDMPAYNSKLYIREPVSESRLHDALRLIKLEHEQDWTRNIALIGQLRYDLYAQSLVSRY